MEDSRRRRGQEARQRAGIHVTHARAEPGATMTTTNVVALPPSQHQRNETRHPHRTRGLRCTCAAPAPAPALNPNDAKDDESPHH
jgi:hypothetical protein